MMPSKQYHPAFGQLFSQWCLVLVMGATLAVDNVLAASTTISSIRVRQSPERTRIVFDLNKPATHKIFILSNPRRLVIDVQNALFKADISALSLQGTPINALRFATRNGKDVRVVLELNKQVKPRSFALKPIPPYSDRLVIDLYGGHKKAVPVIRKADRMGSQMRDIVIVIDPGHGGDDPGAVGKGKLYEKHVVLAIAKKTAAYFKKEAGYKAVLTRKGDYYLAHRKRTSIARQNAADVFISIHADAFKNARARGASVYAISQRGASSEAARWLAEKENRADLIGGVSLNDQTDEVTSVLLDLSLTHSLVTSLAIGKNILKAIGSFNKLHKKTVEQAAFIVLKSPDIPSLLIETGYISNPAEAAKLKSKRHQAKMAKAIFTGVHQYMLKHPPEGSFLARKKRSSPGKILSYQIKRGDTLSAIALKYRVSAKKIMRLNGLRNANIKAGQVLKIPLG